jgi:hypothetical protein
MYIPIFKTLFLVFFLFGFVCIQVSFGQNSNTNEVKDPLDIISSSPTANSLGQYGGVNVGLASGTVNKSIDLYNFVSGPLQVPISINYSSNGLKVNDNGGIIGTSWTANIGGVIRRTVMGEDDERNTTRLPSSFNPYGGDTQTLQYIKGMINYNTGASVYDGEPDVFSFNFGNYSGKFIFDENGDLILLNYSGLKIKRITSTHYIIYTPDGIKYEFGGPATENSYKMGTGCGKVFANPTNTAFFLYKITHPNGSVINLLYEAINYTYVVGVNESRSYRIDNIPQTVPCNSGAPEYTSNSCVSIMYTNTFIVKEINSVFGKVLLNYIDHNAADGKILSDVKVFRTGSGNPLKQISLGYLTTTTGSGNQSQTLQTRTNLRYRSFLTEIQVFDSIGSFDSRYKFAYKNLNQLPARFSNSQDYFGYYNGKNNSTLIPKSQDKFWEQYFQVYPSANRDPDERYVSIGMLSSITYPTGGKDSLIYEPNSVWKEYTISAPLIENRLTANGIGNLGTGVQNSSIFTVTFQQKVLFSFFCEINATDGIYPGSGRIVLLENGVNIASSNVQAYKSGSMEVVLSSGKNYQVRLEAGKGDKVSCTVDYAYKSSPDVKSFKNQISAGVRIAKVITSENVNNYEKKYYYHNIKDLDKKSTGNLIYDPYFEWHTTGIYKCEAANTSHLGQYEKHILSSNSLLGDSYYDTAPIFYTDVFEEEDQNNGGIIYKFTNSPNSRPRLIRGEELNVPWTSNAYSNGLEVDRLIFKLSVNNVVLPIKRVSTTYKSDERKSNFYRAFVVNERFITTSQNGSVPSPGEIDPIDILQYDHLLRWIYVDSIKTKDYATNGIEFNETIEAFFYDNEHHAQLSRKTNLDSKSERTVNQTIYPGDYVEGEIFIDNMVTNYLSGYPVENILYRERGNTKSIISGSVFNYKVGGKGLIDYKRSLNTPFSIPLNSFKFSNRTMGILPPSGTLTIFSPDNRYVNDYKILTYTTSGRPQEIKKQEEPVTTYLWGYGGQYPIAEIKNATYSEVETVLTKATIDALNLLTITETTIKNAGDKLRNDLPNAMITSYTYQPLVGMKSKTDARGVTEYYEYDGLQRLKAVLDQVKNVTSSMDYHYRPN